MNKTSHTNIESNRKALLKKLSKICLDKNLNQLELAKITGLKQSNISRIFSAKYSPTLDSILQITNAASVDIDFKTRGENES